MKTKDEKDESEDEDEPGDQDEADPDDELALGTHSGNSALSDFQYNFEAELRQPSRNLLVKDLMLAFNPDTVYGNRAAFLKGMVVTVS